MNKKIFVICVVGWLGGAAPAAYAGVTSAPVGQPIAAQATAQIQAILAEKARRTPVERKLDSNLLHATRAFALTGSGSMAAPPTHVQNFVQANIGSDGTIKVTINLVTPGGGGEQRVLAALQRMGATDLNAVSAYGVVTARLPVSLLINVAGWPEVRQLGIFDPGTTQRYLPTPEEQQVISAQTSILATLGIVYPANVIAHGADVVQQAGITGAGVKVCVLSDGVNSLATEQAAGRLPAVDVVSGQAGNGDEGTAMLEIVHQMAPGATLGFAQAFSGEASMASNILALRNAPHNCDILVDDVTYFLEAAFQDGPIAQAVSTVTSSGALYFSSAANSGSLAKGTSGTWEGDFVNSGTTIGAIGAIESGTIHSFNGYNYNTLNSQGGSKFEGLSWSDPMGASCNDYDFFVLNATLTTVIAQSTNSQTCTQNPQEYSYGVSIPAGSKIVVVNYLGTAAPRALRLDTERGRLAIGTNGNAFGHNAAADTITVAAVDVGTASGGVFVGGAANPVEYFSSDGPRRIFYSPSGTALTPGNLLYGTNGGTLIYKVDISAADRVATALPFPYASFWGTSAAAPHAAAIAALIKSARAGLTSSQIRAAMYSTALDIEAAGADVNSGHGLLRADLAIAALAGGTPPKADFNGDGKSDILWYNAVVGSTTQWLMNGNSVYSNILLLPGGGPGGARVVGTGDFNGDGRSDILWHNPTNGNTRVWLMDGASMVSNTLLLTDFNWHVIGTGDFNGDGKSDILWYNATTGSTTQWLMNGASVISNTTLLSGGPGGARAVGTGDFNGDGKTDILWYNPTNGNTRVWMMDGASMLSNTLLRTDFNWQVIGTGDFNGDGKSDILWYNASTGSTVQWLMNGNSIISTALLLTGSGVGVVGTGDFNGDGKSDILWYNATNGRTRVWLIDGVSVLSNTLLLADFNWQIADY